MTLEDAEEYGDRLNRKPDNILRVMLHNVNRLPISGKSDKSKKLVSMIAHKQIDVALLTEIGLSWTHLDNTDRWYERVREAFQSTRSEVANNETEPDLTDKAQFGGVLVMAVDDVSHRVISQGKDPTGLGRWSWIRMEGKQKHFLRIVSAYRPVDSLGTGAVHSQHERYFAKNDRGDDEPRQAFYDDLLLEVNRWKAAGDHIIIGLDANEDVRTGATLDAFVAMGMRELILDAHGRNSPPATCDKNNKREPIDGIFATPGIGLVAGGYSSFNSGCPSDHRYLWIDISYNDAFGYASPPLVSPSARRLKTRDPKMVQRYNAKLALSLRTEGLDEALADVSRLAELEGWSNKLEAEYNRINDRQYEIRKKIESHIPHLRTGAIPWSPKLQRYRDTILIWSMMLKKRQPKPRKISDRKLRRLLLRSDITDAYSKTPEEIRTLLNEAYISYKKAREDASAWRDEFLVGLASSRADHNGTDKETELKQLRTIEKQRTVSRNIKRMQGKLQRNATTQVFVNDQEGRRLVTTKQAIEAACINENLERFTQSESTPFMQEPLLSALGFLADTPEADAILDGTYEPPPGTDRYAKLLIQELRMPENVRNNPMPQTDVTPDVNRQAWNRQKEAVSSDPEGLTFSHYKAGAADPLINEFDARLRGIPYKYGFSPNHWQQITDVEILKKAGVYDIDKMRTITLMDAAFNMNNKQLGRDLMNHAEKMGNLAREQYGSRKHHQSSTAATNKVLTMDLLRLRHQAGALCSNDAKSCYDRIVHSVAALSMRRQGAPKGAVASLLLTLQKAKHRIRTAFGISKTHYGGDRTPPVHGLGQGNGVAPTGWGVISTALINMMRTAGYGLEMLTCLSKKIISFVCYAFVDDTDIVHTGKSVDTPGEEILQDMQGFVEHWEGGLRATGGALRVDKSAWYLIDFKWINNKWSYATKADIPGDIHVRDADGDMKVLQRLEPKDAIETLGIFIAMDGNQKAEVAKLRSKAVEFAEQVRTGFVTRDEAWHALNSTIMKTLEYPMEAISLNRKQWDYIMAPIVKAVLPRSGIVRSFPHDVLYAPDNCTGLGVMHPFYKQNLKQLDLVLRETLKPSITSHLLNSTLEQMRLEVGLPGDDWMMDQSYAWTTACWLRELLLFCEQEDLSLQDTAPKLEPFTSQDVFIMKSFADSSFTPNELRQLNECRLYLRVITVSDLCTANLETITHEGMYGKQLTRHRVLDWPRRPPKLSQSHWQTWQRALHRCFLVPASQRRRIRLDLGLWLSVSAPDWLWYYSTSESRIYHKQGNLYKVYAKATATRSRASSSRFKALDEPDWSLPYDALLATVTKPIQGYVQLTATAARPPLAPSNILPYHTMTIKEILQSRPSLDQWAVMDVEIQNEGLDLAMGIISGHATAVSDGSYKDNFGTSAFVLRGAHRSGGAIGVNAVPGEPGNQSSYRSELAGISGSLAIISAVCDKYDINSGSITIALDGKEAMRTASSVWPQSPHDTDFDLITDIRSKVAKLPLTCNWHWIEGHQDDHHAFHTLSPLAQDNVIADKLAKHLVNRCIEEDYIPDPQRFGDEGWSVSWRGRKLTNLNHSLLYGKMWFPTALKYWGKKHDLPPDVLRTIDWDACGSALGSLKFNERRRLIKHATGHFGIGAKMLQWGFWDHDECPMCSERETPQHVMKCKDRRSTTAWDATILKLENWLIKKDTDPEITEAIIEHLVSWRNDLPSPSLTKWTGDLHDALLNQCQIGWYPFLMGHISYYWIPLQQAYYTQLDLQNTGKKWAKQLILKAFNTSWDMWEHRNGIKHNTITPAKIRALQILDDSIRDEYSVGDKCLLHRDKRWFSNPLSTVLDTYSVVSKKQWLASVVNARLRWTRRRDSARAAQDKSRQALRTWLDTSTLKPTPRPSFQARSSSTRSPSSSTTTKATRSSKRITKTKNKKKKRGKQVTPNP